MSPYKGVSLPYIALMKCRLALLISDENEWREFRATLFSSHHASKADQTRRGESVPAQKDPTEMGRELNNNLKEATSASERRRTK